MSIYLGPARVREYLLTPSLSLRKQRINEIITLLVQYDMKGINEQFYELISKNDEVVSNPYDVEWSQYDALQPIGDENHEGNH